MTPAAAQLHNRRDGKPASAEGGQRDPAYAASPRILRFPENRHGSQDTGASHAHGRRRSRILLVGLLVLGIVLVAGLHLSRPLIADQLAQRLPAQWVRSASQATLDALDKDWLQPTALPLTRQDAIRAHFAAMRAPSEGAPAYRLLFRRGDLAGARAFALPGGELVVTDEIVNLAQDDREVLALLAHLLGKLQQQRRLEAAIRDAMLPVLTAVYLQDEQRGSQALARRFIDWPGSGDANMAADRYALAMLRANAIEPVWLASMLQRIDSQKTLSRPGLPGILTAEPVIQQRIDLILRDGA